MKGCFIFLALLACLVLESGCFSFGTAAENLPSGWNPRMEHTPGTPVEIFGTYANDDPVLSLTKILFDDSPPYGQGLEVQFQQQGDTRLDVTVWQNHQVIQTKSFHIIVDDEAGKVTLPSRWDTAASAKEIALGVSHLKTYFYKGTDGWLYAQVDDAYTGFLFFIPMHATGSTWHRWKPIAPAPLPPHQ